MTTFLETVQRRLLVVPGFYLVALGAALWGTDAFFRQELALDLPAATIVFWEHLILAAVTLPLLLRFIRRRPQLDRRDIVALLLIGVGASAVATMLFTQAFTYGDPITPQLLQKLQPVVAILGAYLLLSERPLPRYGIYFMLAVGGAWLISFRDPTDVSVSELAPALYALAAAVLWGMGTVLGRQMTARIQPDELAAVRFGIGLPAAAVIVGFKGEASIAAGIGLKDFGSLLALALIVGLAAFAIYYRGLARTPASLATLAELSFPLTAILIGIWAFDRVPDGSQWLGIVILAGTILTMGLAASREPTALGVRAPALVDHGP